MFEKVALIILLILFLFIGIFIHKRNITNKADFNSMIRLFPFWVKFIGIAIVIMSIFFHWNDLSEQTVYGKIWQFCLGLGLLLICLTKERNEDELVMQIRLNMFFVAFFLGIIVHISFMIIEKLSSGDMSEFSTLYSTNYILIMYIFLFYSLKRKLKE